MTIFFSPLSFQPIKFRCEEDVKGAAYECSYFLSWINGEKRKKKKEQSFLLDLKSQQESEKRDDHEFWKIFFSFLGERDGEIQRNNKMTSSSFPTFILSSLSTFQNFNIYLRR